MRVAVETVSHIPFPLFPFSAITQLFCFPYFHFRLSLFKRCVSLQVGACLGPRLESLALPGSSITEASLLALLPRLTSLRRLDLGGLDSLFMSGAFLSREEHRRQVALDSWSRGVLLRSDALLSFLVSSMWLLTSAWRPVSVGHMLL